MKIELTPRQEEEIRKLIAEEDRLNRISLAISMAIGTPIILALCWLGVLPIGG